MQETMHPNHTLHVTIGARPMDLKVEGVFIRNTIEEIDAYINTTGRKALEEITQEQGVSLQEKIQAFNDNAYQQTLLFNQNAQEQKSYIIEDVEAYASGDLEACPTGSAKYWSEQAKINYEEALILVNQINNEEV